MSRTTPPSPRTPGSEPSQPERPERADISTGGPEEAEFPGRADRQDRADAPAPARTEARRDARKAVRRDRSRSAAASREEQSERSARRHPVWRWVGRIGLVVLALLVLVVVTIQVVLWTNLPKSIVIGQLEKQLGLRASASSVSAGWFGNTTLRDVKLSLPLARQSTFDAPVLRVKHTWLPALLFGTALDIQRIELDNPTLHVWQDSAGRWNVTEVAELLARTGGKKEGQESAQQAQQASGAAPPKLPALAINNATIHVVDNANRELKIEHAQVNGVPESVLVYRYEVSVPDHVSVAGRLVPGGQWTHEVDVKVVNVNDWLAPWAKVPPFALEGQWSGEAGGGVAGRLRLDRLSLGGFAAKGAITLTSKDGVVDVHPDQLAFDAGKQGWAPIRTTAGRITFDGKKAAAEHLQVFAFGGISRIDGSYAIDGTAAELNAVWEGISFPAGSSHGGSARVNLARRLDGGPDLKATLTAAGTLKGSPLDAKLQLTGGGRAWDDLSWRLTAPGLRVGGGSGKPPLDLAGLIVDARTYRNPQAAGGTEVTVNSVRLPDQDRLNGAGSYNLASGAWWAKVGGGGWPVSQLGGEALAFDLDASGTAEQIYLKGLSFWAADVALKATGSYVFSEPKPVHVDVTVNHREKRPTSALIEEVRAELRGGGPKLVSGMLDGKARLTGTIDPLGLDIDGNLTADELSVWDRPIGKIEAVVKGSAGFNEKWNQKILDVHTKELRVFDGKWDLDAHYLFENETTGITVSVKDLPLKALAEAGKKDDVSGRVTEGHWQLYTPGFTFDPGKMVVHGGLTAEEVKAAGFTASRFTVGTTLEKGKLTVPLEGHYGPEGPEHGLFKATVETNASDTYHVEVTDLLLKRWPLTGGSVALTVDGQAKKIVADLANEKAAKAEKRKTYITSDSVVMGASLVVTPDAPPGVVPSPPVNIGNAQIVAAFKGRLVDVRQVTGDLFGSALWGQAVIDYDHPLLAAGELTVDHVKAEEVAKVYPFAKAISGQFGLHARLAPGREPGALEPLRLDVAVDASPGAQYANSVELGDGRFRVYLNLDPNWGLVRAVMADEKAPDMPPVEQPGSQSVLLVRPREPYINTMYVAQGMLKVWGRVVPGMDEGGRIAMSSISTHVRIGYQALDVNELVHAGAPKAAEMPGKMSGYVVLWGSTSTKPKPAEQAMLAQATGQARAQANARSREAGSTPPPQIAAATAPATNPVTASATTSATGPATNPAAGLESLAEAPPPTLLERLVDRLQGQGAVEIREANLGDFTVFRELYGLMHVGQDMSAPTGRGDATFRIEQGTLNITGLHYVNKGVEARAVATVRNLKDIPYSPLEANAVGSIRPFKDIDLPVFADADLLLKAIETSATSVSVGGTVHDPKVTPVLFGDLNAGMKQFLTGDISREIEGSAGQ